MKKGQASMTAEGIALAREIESNKPEGERICYDPLARYLMRPWFRLLGYLFSGYGESRAPGAMGFLVARTRHIDEVLKACIADGISQVVILGAGLDSRAYRFPELKERVKVFEVDHPASQQVKLNRLQKHLGRIPDWVTFVPIDFALETLDECLPKHGYDERLNTLFIWEGVVYYLPAEAVDATLAFIARHSGAGSSIVFDYVYAEALTAKKQRGEVSRMRRYKGITGEGFVFGIPQGTIETFLEQRGFECIESADSETFRRLYFHGVNADRVIAPIYAIVHAYVQKN